MTRPSFDEVALQVAEAIAQRSTCLRLHTAAVITTPDNRIIATGYNGSLPGQPHCDDEDVGCEMVEGHCIRTMHAEANAIAQAAKYGISLAGCTMYILHRPCVQCAKLIISVGIKQLVFAEGYREDDLDTTMLKLAQAGVHWDTIFPTQVVSYQPLRTLADMT